MSSDTRAYDATAGYRSPEIAIFKKALWTDGRTDLRTDGQTGPLIVMQLHLKRETYMNKKEGNKGRCRIAHAATWDCLPAVKISHEFAHQNHEKYSFSTNFTNELETDLRKVQYLIEHLLRE